MIMLLGLQAALLSALQLSLPPSPGEELRSPFTCSTGESDSYTRTRRIVLVSAHLFNHRDLVEKRLRAIGGASPGGEDDVDVVLSGLLFKDARAIEYEESRLGDSMNGRLWGLEGEGAFGVGGLLCALFSLSDRLPGNEIRDHLRQQQSTDGVKLYVLRQLYLNPFIAQAWIATPRPILAPSLDSAGSVASIEALFDLVVRSASLEEPGIPAPDSPDFEAAVIAPRRAFYNDDLSFLRALRALLGKVIQLSDSRPLACETVAPGYQPDWGRLTLTVRDRALMPSNSRNLVMEDIVFNWRHFAGIQNLAEIYCQGNPDRPLEVILSSAELEHMKALLEQFLGSRVPIEVRSISD